MAPRRVARGFAHSPAPVLARRERGRRAVFTDVIDGTGAIALDDALDTTVYGGEVPALFRE